MRYGAKRCVVWGMLAFTWPLGVPSRVAYRWWGSEAIFDFCAKLLSLVPGIPGQYARTSFYVQTLDWAHYDLAMAFGSFVSRPTARLGRRVVVGSYTIIGNATIEDGVLISSRVSVLSGKHQHGSSLEDGELRQEPEYGALRIGAESWIGEGAVVMASIGRQCIVSAGSVVTKPAPDRTVAIGNPARFLYPAVTDVGAPA